MIVPQDKFLIIYHKEDNDGLFSMAIIFNYLVNDMHIKPENIHRLGADYKDMNIISTVRKSGKTELDRILDKYQHIIMTDISFNDFSAIKKIYKKLGHEFVWIDHHAPIIKQSVREKMDKIPGVRDTNRSAILNAYKYTYDPFDEQYNNKDEKIELFRILSAFDSWTYEREGYTKDYVFSVNTAVINRFQLQPEKIIQFVNLVLQSDNQKDIISKFSESGKEFNDNYYNINHKIVEDYAEIWNLKYVDKTALVIFQSGQTSSMWFEPFADKADCGLVFKHLNDGSWGVSLYNTSDDSDFHCGNYLKEHYGGGGHAGAAGCQLSQDQFIDILKNKTL